MAAELPKGHVFDVDVIDYHSASSLSDTVYMRPSLPKHCPLCRQGMTGEPVSLHDDPEHWPVCPNTKDGELRRCHNAVLDAFARVAGQVGVQVVREVEGLDPDSKQRPDLQLPLSSPRKTPSMRPLHHASARSC